MPPAPTSFCPRLVSALSPASQGVNLNLLFASPRLCSSASSHSNESAPNLWPVIKMKVTALLVRRAARVQQKHQSTSSFCAGRSFLSGTILIKVIAASACLGSSGFTLDLHLSFLNRIHNQLVRKERGKTKSESRQAPAACCYLSKQAAFPRGNVGKMWSIIWNVFW